MRLPAIGGAHDAGRRHGRQAVPRQTVVAHGAVAARPIAMWPWTAGVDVHWRHRVWRQPTAARQRDACGPVSAPDHLGRAGRHDQPRPDGPPARCRPEPGHLDGQPVPGARLHHRHPLQGCAVAAAVVEHGSGPDGPRRRRLHRDHRAGSPPPLARALADLQPGVWPEPRPRLLMPPLATTPAPRPHPPVAIAGLLAGPRMERSGQRGMGLRAGLGADRRAPPRQSDTGAARRESPGDQEVDGRTAGRHRHDVWARSPGRASTARSRAASRRVRRTGACATARQRWVAGTVMPPNGWRQRENVCSLLPCSRHRSPLGCSPRSAWGHR
jgi:hypothetical protein